MLEVLHTFTSVKRLYLSKEISSFIAPILQGLLEERATELLPALQRLSLEGLVPRGCVEEVIKQFVAARQLASNSMEIEERGTFSVNKAEMIVEGCARDSYRFKLTAF